MMGQDKSSPILAVRIDAAMLKRIEAQIPRFAKRCKASSIGRADVVRFLLAKGLTEAEHDPQLEEWDQF